jgi:hypothetical protein
MVHKLLLAGATPLLALLLPAGIPSTAHAQAPGAGLVRVEETRISVSL